MYVVSIRGRASSGQDDSFGRACREQCRNISHSIAVKLPLPASLPNLPHTKISSPMNYVPLLRCSDLVFNDQGTIGRHLRSNAEEGQYMGLTQQHHHNAGQTTYFLLTSKK